MGVAGEVRANDEVMLHVQVVNISAVVALHASSLLEKLAWQDLVRSLATVLVLLA